VQLIHYFDYKSPYAYLAQADTLALGTEFGVNIIFEPYTLDIPSYLGAAALDDQGQDTINTRNAHQWRRVRYSYMDCRREGSRQGLVIRGPKKIFDSSLAHIGFYFAQDQGDFRPYHQAVFERFWRRELDIEDAHVLTAVLADTGYKAEGFARYLEREGRERHDAQRTLAEQTGVFGVPSLMLDNELFWGAERIERVREKLSL
jgi:2-hydroxychromene-2-carboxylate isomerase